MKHIFQFSIILIVSFIGELLNHFIPLPIPASIYGMVLLFLALALKIIKLEQVKETGLFLIEVMPMMFIPAAVGLLVSWYYLRDFYLAVLLAVTLVTVIVMAVSGHVTQFILRRGAKKS